MGASTMSPHSWRRRRPSSLSSPTMSTPSRSSALPSLCKARGIPYCIVKSKARLGAVVGRKGATCLAITDVKAENKADLATLVTLAEANFNNVYDEAMRKWGDAESSGRQQAAAAKRGN